MSSGKLVAISMFLIGCLTFSTAAFASSGMDFSNSGGNLTGSNAGLSLSRSTLVVVLNLNGGTPITGNLGTVAFTTGALTSGSLAMGGTFAPGGTFTIDGNGTDGVPNGVLFSGSFSDPVSWTLATMANGTHSYTLSGVLTGTMGGAAVNGVSVQLAINTGKGYFTGSAQLSGGDTTLFASVPEPSTLAMFGTGALALLGSVRRRVISR